MQQILCIPNREAFTTGVYNLPRNLLDEAEFLPREPLETDESKRQICTYTVIWCDGKILTYRRRGSEGRLHDRLSLGVGGHVDHGDFHTSHLFAAYRAAIREIREELGLESPALLEGPRRIILDNSNEVGRVHLGLLFQANINPTDIKPSEEIAEVRFQRPEEISRESLEGWSRLVLDWFLEGES